MFPKTPIPVVEAKAYLQIWAAKRCCWNLRGMVKLLLTQSESQKVLTNLTGRAECH